MTDTDNWTTTAGTNQLPDNWEIEYVRDFSVSPRWNINYNHEGMSVDRHSPPYQIPPSYRASSVNHALDLLLEVLRCRPFIHSVTAASERYDEVVINFVILGQPRESRLIFNTLMNYPPDRLCLMILDSILCTIQSPFNADSEISITETEDRGRRVLQSSGR